MSATHRPSSCQMSCVSVEALEQRNLFAATLPTVFLLHNPFAAGPAAAGQFVQERTPVPPPVSTFQQFDSSNLPARMNPVPVESPSDEYVEVRLNEDFHQFDSGDLPARINPVPVESPSHEYVEVRLNEDFHQFDSDDLPARMNPFPVEDPSHEYVKVRLPERDDAWSDSPLVFKGGDVINGWRHALKSVGEIGFSD